MVTSSATFIGFLGAIYGIMCGFRAAGPKSTGLFRIASELAVAVLLGAMGLLVSVLALWCSNYLRRRLEGLQGELSKAHLEGIERLDAHPEWRDSLRESLAEERAIPSDLVIPGWEVPYDRQHPLALAMWACVSMLLMCWLTTLTGLGYCDDRTSTCRDVLRRVFLRAMLR